MNPVPLILFAVLAILALAGLVISGPAAAFSGFAAIQIHPARLINDYMAAVDPGAALLNAAVVGLVGMILVYMAGVPYSGPTYAAVMTMAGFGLFGKTPVNILPIIAGVWLSALFVGKSLRDYLIIALFGTALGPLVTALAVETGLPPAAALTVGLLGGLVTGFLLPSVAMAMLNLHQGFNLYNMGLTCGFLGLFAASLIKGFGHTFEGQMQWFSGGGPLIVFLIPLISLIFLTAGVIMSGKHLKHDFSNLLASSGQLPSDFMDLASPGAALVNSALIGLAGSLIVYAVGAPFNGPVIGGLLTIMGFGTFGTHIRNAWSVVAGVFIAIFLTGNEPSAPGPILAIIFCTTLAPLAGEFGIFMGLGAGFVHFIMVIQTGSWHGAMNLYNNGFAGGVTAALFVAVIHWYKTNKGGY